MRKKLLNPSTEIEKTEAIILCNDSTSSPYDDEHMEREDDEYMEREDDEYMELEENLKNAEEELSSKIHMIKKIIYIFILISVLIGFVAHFLKISDPIGVGLLAGLIFLGIIYLILNVIEKIRLLRWVFSLRGGQVGAVLLPIWNLINEPEVLESVHTASTIVVLIIISVVGAFSGSVSHWVLMRTSWRVSILGAIAFNIFLLTTSTIEDPSSLPEHFLIYQLVVGAIIGATLFGCVHFCFQFVQLWIESLKEKEM